MDKAVREALNNSQKIGVKGYAPAILDNGGYCEVSLTELSDIPPATLAELQGRLVILCGLRELKNDCWEELRERMEQIAPLAVLWTLPPQFPLWGDIDELFETIRDTRLSPEIHYIAAPFPLKEIWSRPKNVACDPLAPESMGLDQTLAKSAYWRIHGWHPERWVRLYAPSQIKNLARSIKQVRRSIMPGSLEPKRCSTPASRAGHDVAALVREWAAGDVLDQLL